MIAVIKEKVFEGGILVFCHWYPHLVTHLSHWGSVSVH
jgi:hypothetical protein